MPDRDLKSATKQLGPIALVGQLGLVIAGPIVIAVLLAVYFDAAPVVFILFIGVGIAAGILGAYRIIAPFIK
jgi:hypothetical protein